MLAELLSPTGILLQPYKGRILKELFKSSDQLGFGNMLERALIDMAVDINLLPIGTHAHDRGVRSILAWDWKGQRLPRYGTFARNWKTSPATSEDSEVKPTLKSHTSLPLLLFPTPASQPKTSRTSSKGFIPFWDEMKQDLEGSLSGSDIRKFYVKSESGRHDVFGEPGQRTQETDESSLAISNHFGPFNQTAGESLCLVLCSSHFPFLRLLTPCNYQ